MFLYIYIYYYIKHFLLGERATYSSATVYCAVK